MFSYENKHSEYLVLEAIIKSLEDALDNSNTQCYIDMDSEAPF
jgi:ribonuclease HI